MEIKGTNCLGVINMQDQTRKVHDEDSQVLLGRWSFAIFASSDLGTLASRQLPALNPCRQFD